MWKNLSKYADLGLFLLRVILGSLYLWAHGWPKLAGGLVEWKRAGLTMKYVGITFWPTFWGCFMAFAQSVGVTLFIIGLFFRPSCLLLFLTLTFASIIAYRTQGLLAAEHAIQLAIIFFALLFVGPGKFSADKG
ncbi:MAG: putative oxidoreductase [Chthoniobacter sp.]|nr:putative oxidoreductase [Chthoniobacter sp.]